jgi:putative Ca2+/H+ antiporter (TMEM165/GDT1 family)
MEAFLNTALVVALGEMGDKTQVLALLLAARYRKPWLVAFGILLATLVSMAITAWLGAFASHLLPPSALRWILVAMFLAIAVWTLIPEREEQDDAPPLKSSASLILTAFLTFLLAELGDKSQVVTFAMAAKYQQFVSVLIGAVAGGMAAIVPAVLLGKTTGQWLPLSWVRITAAAVFAALGLWVFIFGLGE